MKKKKISKSKIILSIRERYFEPLKKPLYIKTKNSPNVAHPERLYGVKITKIEAIANLALGHL